MHKLFSIVLASAGLLNLAGCGTGGQFRAHDRTAAFGTVRMIEQTDRPAATSVTTSTASPQRNGAQRASTTYQYTVQMDTGELRTFAGDADQGFKPGQRVHVVEGTMRRP